jgi:hypothetical protein
MMNNVTAKQLGTWLLATLMGSGVAQAQTLRAADIEAAPAAAYDKT